MKQFKIRCSAIGDIMAGDIGLTDKQREYLAALETREKPLTDNMKKDLAELKFKRDNPELPQSAKTYCLNWIKEQLYQKRKDFSSKYTEKGILMEADGIDFCSDLLGWGMVAKNTERFEDEWKTGEPDVILSKSVEDIKCSWDCFTFPLFDLSSDPKYWWQLQGYMDLTGKKEAGVNYVLLNAPESIVDLEAKRLAYQTGESEVTIELWDMVYERMSYDKIDPKLRHKRFSVEYNTDAIRSVHERVEMCRKYIASVINTLNTELQLAA